MTHPQCEAVELPNLSYFGVTLVILPLNSAWLTNISVVQQTLLQYVRAIAKLSWTIFNLKVFSLGIVSLQIISRISFQWTVFFGKYNLPMCSFHIDPRGSGIRETGIIIFFNLYLSSNATLIFFRSKMEFHYIGSFQFVWLIKPLPRKWSHRECLEQFGNLYSISTFEHGLMSNREHRTSSNRAQYLGVVQTSDGLFAGIMYLMLKISSN